ncbi:MAG: hypothetical protein HY329_18905 [Chloroflexi bacterium]|nr:hypothetical protein [Chloroflexota bacterium]
MSNEVERVVRRLKEHSQEIVAASEIGRIVVMDSLTFLDARNNSGDVLVGTSFFGASSARAGAALNARGMIACDAGIGKDEAGVAGLWVLDEQGIPAAAADSRTARFGDGRDLYENGVVSRLNERASALGIGPGMSVREAAQRMLDFRPDPPPRDRRQTVVYSSDRGRVVAVLSGAYSEESNRDDVLCVGSHAGVTGAGYLLGLRPRGVLANDGGFAKDGSGVGSLPLFDQIGVPAVAVAHTSARIGDAVSTYEDGIVSAANEIAQALGIVPGLAAREAARRMLER